MTAEEFLAAARRWLVNQAVRPIVPTGGFDERLLRASLQILPRWQELAALFEEAGSQRRSDMHLMRSLEASAVALMEGVREAFTAQALLSDAARAWRLVSDVSNFHRVGLPLAALFGPGSQEGAGGPASSTSMAAHFHTVALGMAAVAFVEQQALGRAIVGGGEPPAEEGPVPAKDRVRAMRERRRRGLVHRAQVDLTPGDVDLLQAYGFLLPQDREDRRAIDAALSDFVFMALLAHNDPRVSQAQRLAGLQRRIQAVSKVYRTWTEHYEVRGE